MQLILLILLSSFSKLANSLCTTFDLECNACLTKINGKEKVGDTFLHTYHPNGQINSIKFTKDLTVTYPKSHRIATLIVVFHNEEPKLAQVTYSDSNQDDTLFDLFYQKSDENWKEVDPKTFDLNFIILADIVKSLNLYKLTESWLECYGDFSDSKTCIIDKHYFIHSITFGNKIVWTNDHKIPIFSVEISILEDGNDKKIRCKLNYQTNSGFKFTDLEFPVNQTQIEVVKLMPKYASQPLVQRFRRKSLDLTDQSRLVAPKESKLKDIKLLVDNGSVSGGYKVEESIMVGLKAFTFKPDYGVGVKCVNDGVARVWDSNDFTKKFKSAVFLYTGDSDILLKVNYFTEHITCGINKKKEGEEYFVRKDIWYTLTQEKFNEQLAILSDASTLQSVDNPSSSTKIEPISSTSSDSVEAGKGQKRLKGVKLEIKPPNQNDYKVMGYLMDGLETAYYEPKNDALVQSVMDGSVKIWICDEGKKVLKHAKFRYSNSSFIFLEVLYTKDGNKTKLTDYFIKRDQWYHSRKNDFENSLDDLINRVTMRDAIINERMTFDEHISNLKFIRSQPTLPSQSWFKKLFNRNQPQPAQIQENLTPIQFNINDNEFAKEKFDIQINNNTKFGIYTPKNGIVLTRLLDGDRVIWFQARDGLGCTTLYMDFSGNDPLLHLVLDDPADSHKYYKKRDGNWHIIDKEEYETIREQAQGIANPADFYTVR